MSAVLTREERAHIRAWMVQHGACYQAREHVSRYLRRGGATLAGLVGSLDPAWRHWAASVLCLASPDSDAIRLIVGIRGELDATGGTPPQPRRAP